MPVPVLIRTLRNAEPNFPIETWLGELSPDGRKVVVKRVAQKQTPSDSFAQWSARLLDAGSTAAKVASPFLARVIETGNDGSGAYVASEYVQGENNIAALLQSGPLSFERAIRVTWRAARALAAGAVQNVVHGCITPRKIMIAQQPEADGFDAVKVRRTGKQPTGLRSLPVTAD